MTLNEAKLEFTLRLADDRLILSHRLSELCGHGPILEEDIALTNIALDLLGQANSLYEYADILDPMDYDADHYAYKRLDTDFKNAKLVEQENDDFAYTIVRQFIWDTFDYFFCQELQNSEDETLSAIAKKSLKEVSYHFRHSSNWLLKLGDGTEESHQKAQDALENIWMFTEELFETTECDIILLESGIGVDINKVKENWNSTIDKFLGEATLKRPNTTWMQKGARKGRHTEALGHILAEMQYLQRAFPDAKW